jgi:hypothetical protein
MFTIFHEFDSSIASAEFKNRRANGLLRVRLSKNYPPKFFEVKKISGDLDRLFRMGLLKRKRQIRYFQRKDGKSFGRGYKYLYKITRQGWRYATYLLENIDLPPEDRPRKGKKRWDLLDEAMVASLKSKLPEEKRPVFEYLCKYVSDDEGQTPNNRFPRRIDTKLLDDLFDSKYLLGQKTKEAEQLHTLASKAVRLAEDFRNIHDESILSRGPSTPSPYPSSSSFVPPEHPLSGLQLLSKARDYFSVNRINPFIRNDHRTPQSLFAIKGDSGITLIDLIEWAIRYLTWIGQK